MLPSFAYSQRNAVFKTIRADTVKTTTLIVQNSTSIQISDVERVVDKYVDKTAEALRGLADALKVPADHVYSVLIKQQYVKSISWIATGGISLFVIIMVLFYGYLGIKYEWDGVVVGIIVGAGFILFGIPLFISISQLDVILTGFYNPEYGAIKEISNLIK